MALWYRLIAPFVWLQRLPFVATPRESVASQWYNRGLKDGIDLALKVAAENLGKMGEEKAAEVLRGVRDDRCPYKKDQCQCELPSGPHESHYCEHDALLT
jgi:hypothetical protein